MKKNILSTLALASIALLPTVAFAQTDAPASIPGKIRANIEGRIQNADQNGDLRNKILEARAEAATSTLIRQARRQEVQDIRASSTEMRRDASSTPERREITQNERLDIFTARQQALVKQMDISVSNLSEIAGRISSRIDKIGQSGQDTAAMQALLVTAQSDIAEASTTIQSFADYTIPLSVNADASTTVDVGGLRQIADSASNAISTAHDALQAVVKAIIQ